MQYLLTKEEMNALVPKDEVVMRDQALAAAREKILSLSGFGCIYDTGGSNQGGYCDDCPCSRAANDWKREWDHVCLLSQRYSK